MPPLSLLIKPASSLCNLRCAYCFYHSIAENRMTESYGIMNDETLEVIVSKALQFADWSCTFAFQGGEPTLAGLDFFKKLIMLQKKYNTKKVQINNTLQTNGMAIDHEWAEYLSKNRFLVGISLDGPKDLHDMFRHDSGMKGTFSRVMNAISLFNRYKVEYNILFVVNSVVARHAEKVYSFFKRNNFRYLQFIPCLDPLGEKQGLHEFSLSPERFALFLKKLFDLWYDDIIRGNMISIRYFDNLVGMMAGYRPEICGMTGECICQMVIEADGGVYPCDFYVFDEWYMGNIKELSFEELKNSETGKMFVEVSRHISRECISCKWYSLCRGGCRRLREPFYDGKPALNFFCESYREFFEHAAARLKQLAVMFSGRQAFI